MHFPKPNYVHPKKTRYQQKNVINITFQFEIKGPLVLIQIKSIES